MNIWNAELSCMGVYVLPNIRAEVHHFLQHCTPKTINRLRTHTVLSVFAGQSVGSQSVFRQTANSDQNARIRRLIRLHPHSLVIVFAGQYVGSQSVFRRTANSDPNARIRRMIIAFLSISLYAHALF